jgi:hypothetical protein
MCALPETQANTAAISLPLSLGIANRQVDRSASMSVRIARLILSHSTGE